MSSSTILSKPAASDECRYYIFGKGAHDGGPRASTMGLDAGDVGDMLGSAICSMGATMPRGDLRAASAIVAKLGVLKFKSMIPSTARC